MGYMWSRGLPFADFEFLQEFIFGNYRIFDRQVIKMIIISLESFKNIDFWLKDLKTHSNPDLKVFLIGNKADLDEKYLCLYF